MDEAFVCNPAGEAFRNVSLPLHFTVENSYRFPVVRFVDVKNVFFPELKDRSWNMKLSKLGEVIHYSSDSHDRYVYRTRHHVLAGF